MNSIYWYISTHDVCTSALSRLRMSLEQPFSLHSIQLKKFLTQIHFHKLNVDTRKPQLSWLSIFERPTNYKIIYLLYPWECFQNRDSLKCFQMFLYVIRSYQYSTGQLLTKRLLFETK